METEKTYDEFIARQVQAELAGEKIERRSREDLWGDHVPNDFWVRGNITSCWMFGAARWTEFWHVDEDNKVVVQTRKPLTLFTRKR